MTLVEWIGTEVFLRTNIFSGTQQMLLHTIVGFLKDINLMLIVPAVWIWRSKNANWQGWAERKDKRNNYFYYVRKPCPLHDLLLQRRMEFGMNEKIKGSFSFLKRKTYFQAGIQCDIITSRKQDMKLELSRKRVLQAHREMSGFSLSPKLFLSPLRPLSRLVSSSPQTNEQLYLPSEDVSCVQAQFCLR